MDKNNNYLIKTICIENQIFKDIVGSDMHKEEDLSRTGIYTNRKIALDEKFNSRLRR